MTTDSITNKVFTVGTKVKYKNKEYLIYSINNGFDYELIGHSSFGTKGRLEEEITRDELSFISNPTTQSVILVHKAVRELVNFRAQGGIVIDDE